MTINTAHCILNFYNHFLVYSLIWSSQYPWGSYLPAWPTPSKSNLSSPILTPSWDNLSISNLQLNSSPLNKMDNFRLLLTRMDLQTWNMMSELTMTIWKSSASNKWLASQIITRYSNQGQRWKSSIHFSLFQAKKIRITDW